MGKTASTQDLTYLEILRGALGLTVFELSMELKIRVSLLKEYLSGASIPPNEVYIKTQALLTRMDQDIEDLARQLTESFEKTQKTPFCVVPSTTSEARSFGYIGVGYCRQVLATASARSQIRFFIRQPKANRESSGRTDSLIT